MRNRTIHIQFLRSSTYICLVFQFNDICIWYNIENRLPDLTVYTGECRFHGSCASERDEGESKDRPDKGRSKERVHRLRLVKEGKRREENLDAEEARKIL